MKKEDKKENQIVVPKLSEVRGFWRRAAWIAGEIVDVVIIAPRVMFFGAAVVMAVCGANYLTTGDAALLNDVKDCALFAGKGLLGAVGLDLLRRGLHRYVTKPQP